MSQPPPPGPTAHPPGPGDPPGGPPAGSRSRGPLVAIVVGVLIVVGGGVAAVILLLGGDDSEPSTTSPLDTAESFEQAWNLTDIRTLKSLMTDDLRPFAHFDEYDMEQIDLENPEVIEESGTEAFAELEGGDNTYQLYLVKQQGEWLIQELNVDTMS